MPLVLIIQMIAILVVCGIAWHFLIPFVDEPFKSLVVVVVILAACLMLLRYTGVL